MHVLVADDSAVQRKILTQMLRSHGREVVAVCDGMQAWEAIQNDSSINVVITDWTMPEMSGLELIRKVRSSLLERYVYVILCTGRSSRADLIEGMRSGADDFLAKPVQEDELMVRLVSGERVIQLETRLEDDKRKLEKANQSLSHAYATIRTDLDAAARMQRNLLPGPTSFDGVRFESLFCPASVVAGDIFNFFPLSERAVGFYILDVSGHGIPAAMLSVTLSKMLAASPVASSPLKRTVAGVRGCEVIPPDQVIKELNRRFQDNGDMYFTMVYGVIDTKTHLLSVTQAGHPHPIYVPKGAPIPVGHGGFPVGIVPDMEYDLVEQQVNSGDRLYLCSDGVLECFNDRGEQFGMKRLMKFLEKHRESALSDVLQELQEALQQWVGAKVFEDDVSLVAVEIQ